MKICKDYLLPFLIYNDPIVYNEDIVLYPIAMKDILKFQRLSKSIILRKNSIFREKKIIKMSYLELLIYAIGNTELEVQYEVDELSNYFVFALELLRMCCVGSEIYLDNQNSKIFIGKTEITPQIFDDLRRIIIIQNDIDFDIDEFLNSDTEKKLQEAQKHFDRGVSTGNIEDYIDSLIVAMHTNEECIKTMSIRKFWRYVKRYNLHEKYKIMKTGECSGMVSYKEPIQHWMNSLEETDKYSHLKTDEGELRNKLN